MEQEPHKPVAPPAEPIEAREAQAGGRTAAIDDKPAGHGMRNAAIAIAAVTVVLVALIVLLNAGNKSAGTAIPASVASYTPAVHTVSYEADGDGTKAGNYTLRAADGGTRQGEADLPLMNKAGGTGLQLSGFQPGDFVYLSVQNDNGYGSVTCRIVVDGQTISENTSTGGYTIATCQGQVP